jgi:hypothetical protein
VADFACPTSGTIVIYLNAAPGHPTDLFLRAVVSGSGIEDPATGQTWIPLRQPDGHGELLDPSLLIDTLPSSHPTL